MVISFSQLLFVFSVVSTMSADAAVASNQTDEGAKYLRSVSRFADTTLQYGRDRYGDQATPLFVDGLHVETLEAVRWKNQGEVWILCNFASQQSLLRTLDGLTAMTGDHVPQNGHFPLLSSSTQRIFMIVHLVALGRTRTCNRQLRRLLPYPLGHQR